MRFLTFLASFLLVLGAHAQPSPGKTYTHNERGQVLSVSDPAHPEAAAAYTYDANGNRETLTQGGVLTRYDWDARDRLVAIWRNDALLARYRYHWNGLRSEKETFGPNATLVRYQYDGPWLESETNVIGNTLVRYARGTDGRVLSVRHNNDVRFFLSDALGTPTALLTQQGAVVARFGYDVWGNQTRHEGAENTPIRHTGHYFDEESGLYYVAARYYDTSLGAFISEDPVQGIPERPITFNPYVAFNANPTGYVDPDGRQAMPYMSAAESLAITRMARNPEEMRRALDVHSNAQRQTAWQAMPLVATSFIGAGLASAAQAGWTAYRTTGFAWGVAVASSRAAPYVEAGAAVAANVPGPGIGPMPLATTAAARTEAMMAQEARAAAYADDVPRTAANLPDPPPTPAAATFADNLPPPPPPSHMTVVEGASGVPQMVPSPGTGPVGATGPPGRALSMETGPYREMKNRTDIPGQAHHLNQDSMYRDRIPHGDAITVKLEGNAFAERGTPHYVVHQAQEEFLNQFRRGGARGLETPTNLEMTRSVVDALRRAGYTEEQSMALAHGSIRDRVNYNLLGGERVPRLPGRINQKKPEATDEP